MIEFRCPRCEKTKPLLDAWWSENTHVCKSCAEDRVVERRAEQWEAMANQVFNRPPPTETQEERYEDRGAIRRLGVMTK